MTYFPMLFQENPSQNSCMYIMGERINFSYIYIQKCVLYIVFIFILCMMKREEKKEKRIIIKMR